MKFGAALKEARVRAGVSPGQLAETAGWSRTHVHRVERQENVSEATIERYCAALELEAELTLRATRRK